MTGYEMPPLASENARVLPFRRPSRAVRVRRRNPWLVLARGFAQALLVVGLPALGALWLFTSPTFALSGVELGEHRFVDEAWVDHALAPLAGRNVLRLDLDDVRIRLAEHPWVASVTVEKRLPNRLRVDFVERRPTALLRTPGGLTYLDDAGKPIAPYDPARGPGDLLLVSTAGRGEELVPSSDEVIGAYALAEELASARNDWWASLSEIEILGGGDFRLHLAALDYPVLVRASTVAGRLAALAPLLPELERRYRHLAFIDLRFDRRIVFQPAPTERTGEWPRQNSTS